MVWCVLASFPGFSHDKHWGRVGNRASVWNECFTAAKNTQLEHVSLTMSSHHCLTKALEFCVFFFLVCFFVVV